MSDKAIEWDQTKALANVRKHGVSFEEAALALADDAAYYKRDDLHSDEEDRFIIVCSSSFDCWPMKKKTEAEEDPLDREIDFSDAKPSTLGRDFHKFKNIRVAPDLLAAFPDSQSMNEALRTLVSIAERTQKPPVREKISARRVSAAKPRRKVRS